MKTLTALITLAFASASYAEEMDHSGFGNMTNADVLAEYLTFDDTSAINTSIDRWADGWLDGLQSVYVFEGIVGNQDGSTHALDKCIYERFPTATDIRKQILAWGTNETLKDWIVSLTLYYGIRYACEDVLGEVQTSSTPGDTRS